MDDPLPVLSAPEVRVLGALIEKQVTTPDYYPLSLNALTNACNQLTNREPVVSYDDQIVLKAIDALRDKRLATLFHGAESRVAKYRHALGDVILVTPAETAVLCVLMLRGPQTIGELRTRAERLFTFDNLGEVEATLAALASRQPPLTVKLPRQPGTKEPRFAHLLSGPMDLASSVMSATATQSENSSVESPASSAAPGSPADSERVQRLEQELCEVRRELAELKQQFADFRKQFE